MHSEAQKIRLETANINMAAPVIPIEHGFGYLSAKRPKKLSWWRQIPSDVFIGAVVATIALLGFACVFFFENSFEVTTPAISEGLVAPEQNPVKVEAATPIKIEAIDEKTLEMVAPALSPVSRGLSDAPRDVPPLNIVVTKAPSVALVETISLSELKKLSLEQPLNPLLAAQLGDALVKDNDLDGAISSFRRAVASSPYDEHYSYMLAVLLDRIGEKGQAAEYYGKTLEILGPIVPPTTIPVGSVKARLAYLTK